MANNRLSGLGKGLGAIFMENNSDDKNETVTLKISEIEPNREQPRKEFDEEALSSLSQSIMQYGVLQPILVSPIIGGGYKIVAGERRYRASMMAGLTEIPAVIRELSDSETMELALIENLQREDLTPIEEAKGYKTLMEKFSFTQEDVATSVGKSRSAVANSLRLLTLPDEVIKLVEDSKLSQGHARTLLSLDTKEQMIKAANVIIKGGLSVRQTEKLCKNFAKSPSKKPTKTNKPSYFTEVEIALSQHLGQKVTVTPSKDNKGGTLSITFYSNEDLQALANKLEDK